MSIPALISLSLAWSGLVWLMAYLICCLNPRPKLAQAIWRSAALLLVLPFLAAPFLPGLPAQTALPIDDLIMFEPQFIQTGQVLAVEAVRPQTEWLSLSEATVRKPLPSPAPAPPSPPSTPAPVEPVAAPAPPSPPAPPVPPKAGACPEIDEDLTAAAREMWDDRLALAKMANSQAGQVRDPSELLPTTVTYPAPVYPDLAIQTKAMGACQVIFDLTQAGMAENVAALCTDPMFEQSAIDGMVAARFEPVTDSAGQPVKLSGVLYPLTYCIE